MINYTKYLTFFSSSFVLTQRICMICAVAGFCIMVPTHAQQTEHLGQTTRTARHVARSPSLRWPPICVGEVAQTFHHARSVGWRNLPPGILFRMAAEEGKTHRLIELHDRFTSAAKRGVGPWANHQNHVEMLQAALFGAAMMNRPGTIKLLVGYGADPNRVTTFPSMPAMMVAARCGNIEAMNALYKLGADPSIPAFGKHPVKNVPGAIIAAARARQSAAVLWLLRHGVDVCGSARESGVIMRYVKLPIANGKLSDTAIAALQCRRNGQQALRHSAARADRP